MITPNYGATPLDFDEIDALHSGARDALGDGLTKVAVFDLEQAVSRLVTSDLLEAVSTGSLSIGELLVDSFVRGLHRRLYGDIWKWAGKLRARETNIGVPRR